MTPYSHSFIYFSLVFVLFFTKLSFCDAQVIQNYSPHEEVDVRLIPFQEGKLFGFMNAAKKIVIPPNYESVSFFNRSGFAQIKQYGLYGVIDMNGKEVVPPMSSSPVNTTGVTSTDSKTNAYEVSRSIFFIQNNKTNKWMLFAPEKKEFASKVYTFNQPSFSDQMPYSFRPALSMNFIDGYRQVTNEQGYVNYIDTTFALALDKFYPNVYPLDGTYYVAFNESGKKSIIDKKGRVVLKNSDFDIQSSGVDGFFIITSPHTINYVKHAGLMNNQGKIVIDTVYNYIHHLNKNVFSIKQGRKVGAVTTSNIEVLPLAYQSLLDHDGELLLAKKDGKTGIIDKKGNCLSGWFDQLSGVYNSEVSRAMNGDTFFIIDADGKQILSLIGQYTVSKEHNGVYILQQNQSYGIWTKAGENILPPSYNTVTPIDFEDFFIIRQDRAYGLFSASQGWLYDLKEKQQIYFSNASAAKPDKTIRVTNNDEVITHTNTFSTISNEKLNSSSSRRLKQIRRDGQLKIELQNGQTFSYDEDRSLSPLSDGQTLVFAKTVNNRKQLLDDKLEPLLANEFYLFRDFFINNNLYFTISNENTRALGLVDIKGNTIIEPKERQTIRLTNDNFWFIGQEGGQLFDLDFKPIKNTKHYSRAVSHHRVLELTNNDGQSVDLLSLDGKLLNEGEFYRVIRSYDDFLVVENSPNGELKTCVLDSMLMTNVCLSYLEVIPVKNHNNVFIVKDLYDWGVVRANGEEVSEIKFSDVRFLDEIGLFALRKNDYVTDFMTVDGDVVLSDIEGYPSIDTYDELSYVKMTNEHLFFDKKGKLVQKFNMSLGRCSIDRFLLKKNLVKFLSDEGKTTFASLTSGNLFTPN